MKEGSIYRVVTWIAMLLIVTSCTVLVAYNVILQRSYHCKLQITQTEKMIFFRPNYRQALNGAVEVW